jgi:hypothetical protein
MFVECVASRTGSFPAAHHPASPSAKGRGAAGSGGVIIGQPSVLACCSCTASCVEGVGLRDSSFLSFPAAHQKDAPSAARKGKGVIV